MVELSIEPLTDLEAADLARRLDWARSVVESVHDSEDVDDGDDEMPELDGIQTVFDHEVFFEQGDAALESFGLLFGCVLAERVQDMNWWMAEDEDGRGPVLRYGHTDLLVFPADLIAAQMEEYGEVDVRDLFAALITSVEEIKNAHYRTH